MKQQVDKMASWQNGKLTKWHHKVDKWHISEMVIWWNIKLTKWHIGEMASWQNSPAPTKTPNWHFNIWIDQDFFVEIDTKILKVCQNWFGRYKKTFFLIWAGILKNFYEILTINKLLGVLYLPYSTNATSLSPLIHFSLFLSPSHLPFSPVCFTCPHFT